MPRYTSNDHNLTARSREPDPKMFEDSLIPNARTAEVCPMQLYSCYYYERRATSCLSQRQSHKVKYTCEATQLEIIERKLHGF